MHLNLSTMDTLGTDESGQHCREVQTRVNVWTVCQKKGLCREVAIVQRFKQKSMYGLSAKKLAVVERWPLYRGSNKSQCMDCLPKNWPLWRGGHCTEVQTRVNVWTVCQKMAVVERWPLVDVRLYIIMLILCPQNCYRKGLLFCTNVHV